MDSYSEIQRKLNQFEMTTNEAVNSVMLNTADILKNSEELSKTTNLWLKESISLRRMDTLDFLVLMSSMTGVSIESYLNALKDQHFILSSEDNNKITDIIKYIKKHGNEKVDYHNIANIIDSNHYNDDNNEFDIQDIPIEDYDDNQEYNHIDLDADDSKLNHDIRYTKDDLISSITIGDIADDEDLRNAITDINIDNDDIPNKVRIAFGDKVLTFVKVEDDTDNSSPLMVATPYGIESVEDLDINEQPPTPEDLTLENVELSEEEEVPPEEILIEDIPELEDLEISNIEFDSIDEEVSIPEEEPEEILIEDISELEVESEVEDLEISNIEFDSIDEEVSIPEVEPESEPEYIPVQEVKLDYNEEEYFKNLVSSLDDSLGTIVNDIPKLEKPVNPNVHTYKTYNIKEGDIDV